VTTLVDAPTRVDGVQLIGEMVGSGYRTPPALVRRSDGQVLQLTPLLYLVLGAADGRRSCAEIAQLVGRGLGRSVSESDVRTLVDTHLRPLGLLRLADGSEPELRRSNPLLALKPRIAVTDPRTTRRLTDPFRVLFRPVVAAVVLVAFVAVVGWVFFERGLGATAYDAFERPHLLVLVFVVSVLSGGFHEFGHAAASRYSGAQPGAMGAGLYVVWPAFYTDVTDSYRLGRAGRIRTDLGGLYFNAIVAVLTFVWWWSTGWEALLLLVATQVLQMAQQLLPLLRFDGYHLLADLSGVPDLYQRIRPTLLGLLPHRWRSPENQVLTPWARVVITFWVLVTVPMMVLMLVALLSAVPRLLGSAGAAVRENASGVADAWGSGGPLDVAGHALQLLGVVLPVLACAVMLVRLGLRWFRGLSTWSRGSAVRRATAVALSAVLVTGLSWAWWPHPGTYRPIQPGERGTLTALLDSAAARPASALADPAAGAMARPGGLPIGAAARSRLSGEQQLVAAFPKDGQLPTEEDPVLTMVLVPSSDEEIGGRPSPTATATASTGTTQGEAPTDATTDPATTDTSEPWVFPFDQPLPPEEGDNQALAVNTTDDSVTYDVAFALVWADGDEVLNVNEAHAYASCSDCVSVAVAFQVVLIMDDAQVVVPQNLAVAANYDCYECITAAIASQLVLSIPGEPGEEQLLELAAVWDRLTEFAGSIHTYTLTEITEQLEAFKDEITAILVEAPPVEVVPEDDPSATESPSTTPSPTPTSSTSATPSPTTSPTTGSTTPTPTPGTSPTPSPTSSPTPTSTAPSPTTSSSSTPTPSPSPTSSPTPSGTTTTTASPSATSSPSPVTESSTTTP
jgi:putative peptide zinc metalloprotease protein